MKRPISYKQQRFLDFIQRYTIENGQAPSYEEIMEKLGLSSLGTIHWYVKSLSDDGYLHRARGPNGKRALILAEEYAVPTVLPLLGIIAAGEPIEALENAESINVPAPFVRPDNFVLKVKGRSMQDDHIEDGDYIIVRKTPQAEPGRVVVALINGEATLKRYYPNGNGVELHPRNPEFPIIKVQNTDDFRINGVVLYSFREY